VQEVFRVSDNNYQKVVRVGLGEAIQRLIHVEMAYRQGHALNDEAALEERKLLFTALNQYELDLGFDCNEDGTPDTVAILQQTAETSCCRILPHDVSRRSYSVSSDTPKSKPRQSSRRKKDPTEVPTEISATPASIEAPQPASALFEVVEYETEVPPQAPVPQATPPVATKKKKSLFGTIFGSDEE